MTSKAIQIFLSQMKITVDQYRYHLRVFYFHPLLRSDPDPSPIHKCFMDPDLAVPRGIRISHPDSYSSPLNRIIQNRYRIYRIR